MQTVNRLKSERPRREYDFYETPPELAYEALKRLQDDEDNLRLTNKYIGDGIRTWATRGMDAGSGNGVWGRQFKRIFWNNYSIGVEIQDIPMPDVYAELHTKDFLELEYPPVIDLVYGNPPYSLAEEFVRHSYDLLAEGGYCYFLLRLAFLESKKRHFGLYKFWKPKRVYVLTKRPSFFSTKGNTKTTDATAYAMFLWQKGWTGDTVLDWMYWEYDK